MCVFLEFYTTQILMSTTLSVECISWLIKVTNNNDARWEPEINSFQLHDTLTENSPLSITKTARLMLSGAIISTYCANHKKQTILRELQLPPCNGPIFKDQAVVPAVPKRRQLTTNQRFTLFISVQ